MIINGGLASFNVKPQLSGLLLNPFTARARWPVVVSVTKTVFETDVASHDVAVPATLSGDLLLVIMTTDSTATITTPAGYTSLYTTTVSGAVRGSAYASVSAGTAAGTVDFVTSSAKTMVAHVYLIRMWYGLVANVVAATPVDQVSGGGVTVTPPSLAPSFGIGNHLWFTAVHTSATAMTVSAYPSGFTGQEFSTSGSGPTHSQLASCRMAARRASMSPGAFTVSNISMIAGTICVRGL